MIVVYGIGCFVAGAIAALLVLIALAGPAIREADYLDDDAQLGERPTVPLHPTGINR